MAGWIAAGSAAADLLGGFMTNDSNRSIAKANRDWQEKMSNTAHQREVQDLKAAGLNPMISAMGGRGADVPTPSTPTMQNPFSSAASTFRGLYGQKQLLAAQVANTTADTAKKNAETVVNQMTAKNIEASMGPNIQHLVSSAGALNASVTKINAELSEIKQRIDESIARTRGQELSNDQLRQLTPLVVRARALENMKSTQELPVSSARGKGGDIVGRGLSVLKDAPSWIAEKLVDMVAPSYDPNPPKVDKRFEANKGLYKRRRK
uniref:DNA pilot protein VP2 n=1 Tax=Gokushovirinae environmental samples TaxID=1478972 RepID=A0A2R3UAT0_9VIRU|nr:DNA pilot protein VP2 [Gokushovirinae environmental samples]